MSELVMEQWCIYRGPKDHPHVPFVVRRWEIRRGMEPIPTRDAWAAESLAAARTVIPPGKVKLDRSPDDDPVIVEVWL